MTAKVRDASQRQTYSCQNIAYIIALQIGKPGISIETSSFLGTSGPEECITVIELQIFR